MTFFESLKTKYYAPVSFNIPNQEIESTIQAFFRFLELPDVIKTHMNFKLPPEQRRGEIGFYHRDPGEGLYRDSKDFFHFHPSVFDRYGSFLEENPIVLDFMKKAFPLWQTAYEKIHEILSMFEPQFPGTLDKVFKGEPIRIFLRFLSYNWGTCGKYLAKPHFDCGAFTLAIAESGPGLRIGSTPENLELVPHQKDRAIFMLSSVFDKVMNTQEFSPGWHDVIQVDETAMGQPFARWAIVVFVEAHGVAPLSRAETHKFYVE